MSIFFSGSKSWWKTCDLNKLTQESGPYGGDLCIICVNSIRDKKDKKNHKEMLTLVSLKEF